MIGETYKPPVLAGDILLSIGNTETILAIAELDDGLNVVLKNIYGYWKSKYSDPETFRRLHPAKIVYRALNKCQCTDCSVDVGTIECESHETINLLFIKKHVGLMGTVYLPGKIIEYSPWNFDFQDMKEHERVKKGIFVHCYGMGEFDVFTKKTVLLTAKRTTPGDDYTLYPTTPTVVDDPGAKNTFSIMLSNAAKALAIKIDEEIKKLRIEEGK